MVGIISMNLTIIFVASPVGEQLSAHQREDLIATKNLE